MFVVGKTYKRQELHDQYGGQRQGGISTSRKYNIIMLFTSERGTDYGYSDKWRADGTFAYFGEGQFGDMAFIRGNAAIRDHLNNDKELHLFEKTSSGLVQYVGQMVCTGYHWKTAPDLNGQPRKAIVFELSRVK